jgi:hypothetical protein
MDGDNAIEALARAVESQIAAAAYKVLGYAQVVADQTGIGTTPVALAGLSLPVQVAANRRIRVSAFGEFTASTSGNTVRMRTLIDGANAQLAAVTIQSGAQVQSVQSAVVVTPTAGLHTFSLNAQMSAGTGTVSLNATAGPCFIMVEDLGPSV